MYAWVFGVEVCRGVVLVHTLRASSKSFSLVGRPDWEDDGRHWPMLSEFGQLWPDVGQVWQNMANFSWVWPRLGPNSSLFCQIWRKSGQRPTNIDQISPTWVLCLPSVAPLGQARTKSARNAAKVRPNSAQCRPTSVGLGPNAGMHTNSHDLQMHQIVGHMLAWRAWRKYARHTLAGSRSASWADAHKLGNHKMLE